MWGYSKHCAQTITSHKIVNLKHLDLELDDFIIVRKNICYLSSVSNCILSWNPKLTSTLSVIVEYRKETARIIVHINHLLNPRLWLLFLFLPYFIYISLDSESLKD